MVLGMTQGLTIREAVELARERMQSNSRISVIDPLSKPFALDISRAQKSGFQAHSFESMINECLSRGGGLNSGITLSRGGNRKIAIYHVVAA